MTDFPDENAVCEAAETIAKVCETFRARPYLCPAGKLTIGYGTTWYPDGRAVTMDDPWISEAQAEHYMRHAMLVTWHGLRKLLTRSPTVNQTGAMLDLAYNVGVGVHDGVKGDIADSDLVAAFNRGDDARVAKEFPLWCHTHKNGRLVVEPGLVKRRALDLQLYQG